MCVCVCACACEALSSCLSFPLPSFLQGCNLGSLPPVLTLALLRFLYDFSKGERYKVRGRGVWFFCGKSLRPYSKFFKALSMYHQTCISRLNRTPAGSISLWNLTWLHIPAQQTLKIIYMIYFRWSFTEAVPTLVITLLTFGMWII